MNQLKVFQDALEKMYSALSVFSDIKWNEITTEYIASYPELLQDIEEFVFNFPHFLQQKSVASESPNYLFELAYFELLQDQIINSEIELPQEKGIYLNPSLSFLNLEFDIPLMMDEATKGNIKVISRPHILCLYQGPHHGLNHVDITRPILEVLQQLETTPLASKQEIPSHQESILNKLIELELAVEVF